MRIFPEHGVKCNYYSRYCLFVKDHWNTKEQTHSMFKAYIQIISVHILLSKVSDTRSPKSAWQK